jgi:hypothetical protein
MYDVTGLREREQQIVRADGRPPGGFGPFWNPPFYALAFVPFSGLPFGTAVLAWLALNLLALAAAVALLCRMLMTSGGEHSRDWRTWGLVPLLVVVSTPAFLAVTHGQNTFGSLLLLTLAVLAWRARRAVLVGLALGLLSYKPQLAAVVGLVALVDLGWKVAAGAALAGGSLVLAAALAMPGILETYAEAMPRLLRFMQVEHVYLWERHATLKAFWRLLLQGKAAGETSFLVNALMAASAGALAVALLVAALRCRNTFVTARRDRLIAATVATMPLVMPFYFDYDLLLLAIPAVLFAAEASRGSAALRDSTELAEVCGVAQRSRGIPERLIVPAFCVLYAWLVVNPDVAERTRVNGAVPLLAVLAGLLVARALRRGGETAQCEAETTPAAAPPALAAAAAA